MLCLFDCLAEGIAALFVVGGVSGSLAMIESGSSLSFSANAAINPRFLVREVSKVTEGMTSPMHFLINWLTESAYTSMLLSEETRNICQST